MRGVFRCTLCSTHFPDAIPPIWFEYWPTHCGETALLMRVLPAEADLPLVAARANASVAVAELPELPELPSYEPPAQEACPYMQRHHQKKRSKEKGKKPLLAMLALYVVRAEFIALPLPLVAILGI